MNDMQITFISEQTAQTLAGPDQFVTSQNIQNFMVELSSGIQKGLMAFTQLIEGEFAEASIDCDGMIAGAVVTVGQFVATEGVDFNLGSDASETAENIAIYYQNSTGGFNDLLECFTSDQPAGFIKFKALFPGVMANAIPISATSGTASGATLSGGTDTETGFLSQVYGYNMPAGD
jgi:hypothetical protein